MNLTSFNSKSICESPERTFPPPSEHVDYVRVIRIYRDYVGLRDITPNNGESTGTYKWKLLFIAWVGPFPLTDPTVAVLKGCLLRASINSQLLAAIAAVNP